MCRPKKSPRGPGRLNGIFLKLVVVLEQHVESLEKLTRGQKGTSGELSEGTKQQCP